MLDMGGKTSSVIRDIADGTLVYVGNKVLRLKVKLSSTLILGKGLIHLLPRSDQPLDCRVE